MVMVEIKAIEGGRFEVFAEGLHHEAFEGSLGAITTAQALAAHIADESGSTVSIVAPWGEQQVSASPASHLTE